MKVGKIWLVDVENNLEISLGLWVSGAGVSDIEGNNLVVHWQVQEAVMAEMMSR